MSTLLPSLFNNLTKPTKPFNFPSSKLLPNPNPQIFFPTKKEQTLLITRCKSSESEGVIKDEWLMRLPEKNKPLYSHSLPCIEAWLKDLGFYQSKENRAVWFIENPDWHAHLSLDVTDLYIRYLKSGPGNLDKDVERRFSYALSRADIENAILGGP